MQTPIPQRKNVNALNANMIGNNNLAGVADMNVIPVVLGIVTAVLHAAPAGPRANGIARGVPNLLAPDNVEEVNLIAVFHSPFGDDLTAVGHDAACTGHQVRSQSAAVLAVTRTGTIAHAADLANATGERSDSRFGTVDGVLFASAHRRDGRSWIALPGLNLNWVGDDGRGGEEREDDRFKVHVG